MGGGDEGEVVGEVLDAEVFVFDLEGGAGVELEGEHAFEGAAVFIEVDEVGGGVAVDPVLVVVAADEDAVVVPFVGGEFFEGEGGDDPGLAVWGDDHFFVGVGEHAAAFFFEEHAIVGGIIGDDIALVASDVIEGDIWT